jgi:NAD(P)-dependent dehydrogenase (short-subunit alcohol dehydrogenase family)
MTMAKTGRSACIVGAGGGIGRATAAALHAAGYDPLLLMDLPGPDLDRVAAQTGTTPIPIDLRDPARIKAAFDAGRRLVPKLDALVLVSGIVENHNVGNMTPDLWASILAVNLTGPFVCVQTADGWLADGGRVVLLGSLSGRQAGGVTGPAYAASKGGIEGLTKNFARYFLPRRITVNTVAPGPIDTPMLDAHPPERMKALADTIPLGRLGRPEEVAALVQFLCSPEAGYITGCILPINGGLRME